MKPTPALSLKDLNTFGIHARAGRRISLTRPEALQQLDYVPDQDLVLGGGSNVLLLNNVPRNLILVRIPGRRVVRQSGEEAWLEVGAGENWHDIVRWSLNNGYSGLENLSLIPGLCGAAPIQNIGAYGVELSDHLHAVRAWDWHMQRWREFTTEQCRFGYRDSRFKSEQPDRYLITHLQLRLSTRFEPRLSYAGIRNELPANRPPSALEVSDAICRIRKRKLPDPETIGNAGSFFKNPVVPETTATRLQQAFPGLPVFSRQGQTCKLSAAWMIEHCGWKGRRYGQAGVSEQHALVLVNHGSATGAELWSLAQKIIRSVREHFGMELEIEPKVINYPAAPQTAAQPPTSP